MLTIRPKILVVDDDESIRLTMKVILEDEGYSVDMAVNGRDAIKMAQKTNYNLALLDIRLPDIEGVELLKLIKDSLPRLRKIMVTGYPSVQNAVAALNRNADAYLIKPVNLDELLTVVKSQLKLQEEEKSFTEEKVAEFIETRVRELSVNSM